MVVMMSEALRMHLHSPEAFVAARNLGAPPPPRTHNLGITGGSNTIVIVAGVESFPLHYGTKRYSIRSRSGSNARLHECS
jgi:hypothetical protein